jgi:hypothetical protein
VFFCETSSDAFLGLDMRNDHICRDDGLPQNDGVAGAGIPAPDLPTDPTETDVPVLLPLLPSADRLLPYLRRIDVTRNYSNHGPLSRELEERLAGALALPEGGLVCASSGTAALVGAILATAGPATPKRPLAIIPAFTFAATASVVAQCGYQPYLADVDPESWMLAADRLIEHPQRQQSVSSCRSRRSAGRWHKNRGGDCAQKPVYRS